MALLAGLVPVEVDLFLTAEGRFLEGQLQAGPEGLALLGTGPAAGGAAPEAEPAKAAQQIAQQVPEIPKAAAEVSAARAEIGVYPGMSELVVPGLFSLSVKMV